MYLSWWDQKAFLPFKLKSGDRCTINTHTHTMSTLSFIRVIFVCLTNNVFMEAFQDVLGVLTVDGKSKWHFLKFSCKPKDASAKPCTTLLYDHHHHHLLCFTLPCTRLQRSWHLPRPYAWATRRYDTQGTWQEVCGDTIIHTYIPKSMSKKELASEPVTV